MIKSVDILFRLEREGDYGLVKEIWEVVLWEDEAEVGSVISTSRDEAERVAAEWEMK